MWNRQRTDEVLLDVENVALGHTSKMRWNPADKWVFSEQIAHPPIIGTEDFELAQATLADRGSKTQHRQHRRPRHYALRGVMLCGLCGRRMSGKWNYFPDPKYTLADIEDPASRNVEYDARLYYPPDVYRKPNPVFPKGFKIDLKKMLRERIITKVKTIFGYDE